LVRSQPDAAFLVQMNPSMHALFLKIKKPATFDKIMRRGKDVRAAGFEMTKQVSHTLGPLFDGAKSAVETQLHRFEAEQAPKQPPAIAPTPTSDAMQLAAKLEQLKRERGLTDEQIGRIIFGGEQPPPVVQVVDTPKPKFVNGVLVV
jgi:hypothetical protein